jgi:penicillin V acylase-like amidase (Ntn superfamily)
MTDQQLPNGPSLKQRIEQKARQIDLPGEPGIVERFLRTVTTVEELPYALDLVLGSSSGGMS